MWTEGQAYAVAPEQLDIIDGGRAAISIGLLLACAIGFDLPDLAFGAVAAFWTCLCDPFGGSWSRFQTMAKFAVLGAIVFALSSFGAHFGTVAATVTLFALVALCCLGRSYVPAFGPGPAQGSFISAIAVVIGVSTPRPLEGAVELGGYFLLGAAVTIVISTLIWPNHTNAPGRLMLVMIYTRLRTMLSALIDLDQAPVTDSAAWLQYETLTRRAVRIAIERGRQIVARRLLGSKAHGHAVDVAARLFAVLIALGQHRKGREKFAGDEVLLLRDLDELLRQVIDCLDSGAMTSDPINQKASLLHSRASENPNKVFSRCIDGSAIALMSLAGTSSSPPRQETESKRLSPRTLRKPTMPSSVVWQQALRVTTAVTACHLIGIWFDVTLSYWGTIATLVVMQPAFGNTWARVIERATGTLLGGLVTAVLLMGSPGDVMMTLMIVPLAAAVIALRTVNYALFMIFLTPMFMLLSDIIRPADDLILLRAVNESLGALFGVVASILVFPTNERVAISDALRAAVSANMSFAASVLRSSHRADLTEIAKAQADAGVGSSRAEVAAAGLSFGKGAAASADSLKGILSALRNVCGASAVFEILGNGDHPGIDRQRADHYRAMSSALEMQLRTWTLRDLPKPLTYRGDALDQAVADLALAVQAFIRSYGNGSKIPGGHI
ncbi:FUSC family protein [Rhizobium johnstonii]|uniref:FUSC family protein n=1 Tax=Rhizobium TaxID=379 RepID=UPI0013EF1533|nr:FUSC family protein [Rhizobium leguminosarum]